MRLATGPIALALLCAALGCGGSGGGGGGGAAAAPPGAVFGPLDGWSSGQPLAIAATFPSGPIETYRMIEAEVSWPGSAGYSNPFDPDIVDLQARFVAPGGRLWVVPGFFDGSAFRVRFAANEAGRWLAQIRVGDRTGVFITALAYTFDVVVGSGHGWVRRSQADPHYLVCDDGTPWFGVGFNRSWSLGTAAGQQVLAEFGGGGLDLLGYWLAPWDNRIVSLASGYDRYDMTAAQRVDDLLAWAEQNEVRLMLAVWPHDYLRDLNHPWSLSNPGSWSQNPFSLLTSVEAFFHDPTSAYYQDKLYRYIAARWAASPALAIWHLVVEVDGTNAGSKQDPWYAAIDTAFLRYDAFGHPTSGSYSQGSWPGAFALAGMPQIHSYENMQDSIGVASQLASRTREMRDNYAKPALIGEFGTNVSGMQPAHTHNGVWASLMAGAASSPLMWADGSGWPDPGQDVLTTLRNLKEFVRTIPFDQIALRRATVLPSPVNVSGYGLAGDGFAMAWLLLRSGSGPVAGATTTIRSVQDGAYQVEWFEPWTGAPSAASARASGGTLSLAVPTFSKDIALKAFRTGP